MRLNVIGLSGAGIKRQQPEASFPGQVMPGQQMELIDREAAGNAGWSLPRRPQDRVVKDRGKGGVPKQLRMMSHKDVHVPRLHLFVCPDHGMISHPGLGIWRVGGLIDACEDMNVRTRGPVVRVPLLLLYDE